jgi:hypothetical protein
MEAARPEKTSPLPMRRATGIVFSLFLTMSGEVFAALQSAASEPGSHACK